MLGRERQHILPTAGLSSEAGPGQPFLVPLTAPSVGPCLPYWLIIACV